MAVLTFEVSPRTRELFGIGAGDAGTAEGFSRSRSLTPVTLERLLVERKGDPLKQRINAVFELNDEESIRTILRFYDVLLGAGIKFTSEQREKLKATWNCSYRASLTSKLEKRPGCTESVLLGELLTYYETLNKIKSERTGEDDIYQEDLSWVGDLPDETILCCLQWMLCQPRLITLNRIPSGLLGGLASLLKDKSSGKKLIIDHLWDDKIPQPNLSGALETARVTGGLEMLLTHMDYFRVLDHSLIKALVDFCRENGDEQLRIRLGDFAYYSILNYERQLDESGNELIGILKTIDDLVPLDKSLLVENIDKIARYRLIFGKDLAPVYDLYSFVVKLNREECEKRIVAAAMKVGDAEQVLTTLKKAPWSDALIYELGIRFAEKEDYEQALECFRNADLENTPSSDELFYKTIAYQAIAILRGGVQPKKVKNWFNKHIKKKRLIKNLEFRAIGEGGYTFNVDFYSHSFSGRSEPRSYCRNAVTNGIPLECKQNHEDKKSPTPEKFRTELFWLDFLKGRFPIKHKVGDDQKSLVISIEESAGLRLEDITYELDQPGGRRQPAYGRKASQLAEELYGLINNGTDLRAELQRRGIPYTLNEEYIAERVDRFCAKVDDPRLREKVRSQQQQLTDCLLAHKPGLIHNDYSPRNLLVEDGNIVVIDHEDYREGHPLSQIVSLAVYPRTPPDMEKWFSHCTKRYEVSPEFVRKAILFRCLRVLASGASNGDPQRKDDYNFFLRKLEEQL